MTGDCYVGSAVRLAVRFSNHKSELRGGTHPNVHLLRAWRKYGESSFRFVTLLLCDLPQLVFFEQRTMDQMKPAYNIERCASSSLGRRSTDETRMKISQAMKGRRLSSEHLAKLLGHPCSPETRAKIAARHLGVSRPKHTAEQRAARSAWMMGRSISQDTIAKRVATYKKNRAHKHATTQAENPPTEPAGRAPTGDAFQA